MQSVESVLAAVRLTPPLSRLNQPMGDYSERVVWITNYDTMISTINARVLDAIPTSPLDRALVEATQDARRAKAPRNLLLRGLRSLFAGGNGCSDALDAFLEAASSSAGMRFIRKIDRALVLEHLRDIASPAFELIEIDRIEKHPLVQTAFTIVMEGHMPIDFQEDDAESNSYRAICWSL